MTIQTCAVLQAEKRRSHVRTDPIRVDQRWRQRHASLVTDGPNSEVWAEKMRGKVLRHTLVGAWRVPAPWPAFIFRTRLYRDHRKSFRLISFERGPTELDMRAAWRCAGREKKSAAVGQCDVQKALASDSSSLSSGRSLYGFFTSF